MAGRLKDKKLRQWLEKQDHTTPHRPNHTRPQRRVFSCPVGMGPNSGDGMAETPPDPGTQDLLTSLTGLLIPIGMAFMGLVTRWADDYRRSSRWSWMRVLVEAPTAVCFGTAGAGIASYLHASPEVAWGIAALMGNLGTRGFFDLAASLLSRRK